MNDLRHIAKRDVVIASLGTEGEPHIWKNITTVEPRKLGQLQANDVAPPTFPTGQPIPTKPVGDWSVPTESAFSIWQLISKFPTLFSAFITLLSGITMKNGTKIATGVTTIIIALAAIFGYDISPELQGIIGSVAALILGWLIPAPVATTESTTPES
ncbi:MAG: hypothetical protein JNJ94_15620 [Chlorobi bacterium]|nr:hypothetical protein [Chlorobiota bacterium]